MRKKLFHFAYYFLIVFLSFSVFVESLFSTNKGFNTQAFQQMMNYAFVFLKNYYIEDVEEEKIFEGALKGMFESLEDPYSQYLTKEELEEISQTTTGDYSGIGISIMKDNPKTAKTGTPDEIYGIVISPFEDSPAFKAGIIAGDYITHVNGESIIPLSSKELSELLKGEEGTSVKLSILRGDNLKFDVVLVREKIAIVTIKYASLSKDIAYIRITQFNGHTQDDFRKALEDLKQIGFKGLILDLRSNPGGQLHAAINMADFLLDKGLILTTKSKLIKDPIEYKASSTVLLDTKVPIIALIDKGSASASEILVGALKDNKRAFVIGEKSFGKGVIQQVIPFYTGGFKLTTSKYFTPSGRSIHKLGIEPDKKVEYKDITKEESESYKKIFENELIEEFLKGRKNLLKSDIDKFLNDLEKNKYFIDKNFMGRIIKLRHSQIAKKESAIYDLDYDDLLLIAYNYMREKMLNETSHN